MERCWGTMASKRRYHRIVRLFCVMQIACAAITASASSLEAQAAQHSMPWARPVHAPHRLRDGRPIAWLQNESLRAGWPASTELPSSAVITGDDREDSLANGAIWGALVGGTLGAYVMGTLASTYTTRGGTKDFVSGGVIGAGLGASIGMVIDALIDHGSRRQDP